MKTKLTPFFKQLSEMPFIHNFSWMLIAEVFSRASRIITLLVLAANFTNSEYGLAMLALIIHELFRVFARLGSGLKIIQCNDSELLETLQNAATLQWFVVLVIAFSQIMLADLIAYYYQQPVLADLLKFMAIAHIFYPIVTVRIFEQQRQNKLRFYGIASGCCIAFENLFIAMYVYIAPSIFAIAYAKIAAAVLWVCLFYRLPSELITYRCQWRILKQAISFSSKTFVSELSRTLRFQADSLFAARLLSPELFGLYSFAKSAGLGIAQSITIAYTTTLYPYLCQQFRSKSPTRMNTFKHHAWPFSLIVCALFILQALAAQFYVEWLFDTRWKEATNLVSLLCIAAIPTLLVDHKGLICRAQNNPLNETKIIMVCTASLIGGIMFMQPNTVYETGFTVVICSFLWSVFLLFNPKKKHYPALLRAQAI